MNCLEEIIKKIVSCKNENIRVNFKELKEAVALEEELKRRGIPFVMDIRLTNTGCNAVIGREKMGMYEKGVKDLHVEEVNSIYYVEKLNEKRVPIGISDYREIKKENAYCVDKTKMIEELLQLNDQVTLITRPRRFGKTLNMSMLAEFFDITKDSRELFKDTYIYRTKYVKEMNKWPVIFLTLKDCKGIKEKLLRQLYMVLSKVYGKYYNEFKDIKDIFLSRRLLEISEMLLKMDISDNGMAVVNNAIEILIRFLYEKYQKKVILLIDEYDTPFISAYSEMYYDEIKGFFTGMFSSALKDDQMLYKGVLTGIQRIAKENLFSDLNNLEVCTMQEDKYSDIFGFTEEETRALLESHQLKLNKEVKTMYDGYRIGNKEIYNPWSIVKYASSGKLKR
ncbi:AAA family ATPase, partial [Absiella sp. AM29-15]|uniref:AAA family ATPase n=1 Tax=Absiella sp. AM29-15 TaxID=2292278 RepID=UPI000E9B13BE